MISPSKLQLCLLSFCDLPGLKHQRHHQVGQSCCCRWWGSIHHKLTWVSKEKGDIQLTDAKKVAFSSYQAQSQVQ